MAEYEFTAEQNQSIDELRQKLFHVSLMLAVAGALLVVTIHLAVDTTSGLWSGVIPAVGFVLLGFVYYLPVDNLKRVTTMKGHDILEMMIGMDDLRIAFTTARFLFVLLILTEVAEGIRLMGFL
jgi:hypothetical protein